MSQIKNTLGFLTVISIVVLYIIWSSKGEEIKATHTFLENESMSVCYESIIDDRIFSLKKSTTVTTATSATTTTTTTQSSSTKLLPTIYFVTPTYPRREQVAELTRLGQTLMHIENLHWIVADDNEKCNPILGQLLKKFGISFTYISSPMPEIYRSTPNVPRGVANRKAALNWIRNNNKKFGVLYFGDDDNTFDLNLFSEIRYTKRVSMFPVGLIGLYAVSSPVVTNGRVIGFFDSWPAKRKWPVDMAGFAVNLDYLAQSPNVTMPYRAGHEEDGFLRSLGLKLEDIEPKANNCTEILVWHTQTKKVKAPTIKINSKVLDTEKSSIHSLLLGLEAMGISKLSPSTGEMAKITKNGKTKEVSAW